MSKPTKKECIKAIDYFFTEGFIDELTSDKKYYTVILPSHLVKLSCISINLPEQ